MKGIELNDFLVTVTGCKQVLIENYKGIKHFNASEIYIVGKKRNLIIQGQDLKVQYYSYEAMKIVGQIQMLEYK